MDADRAVDDLRDLEVGGGREVGVRHCPVHPEVEEFKAQNAKPTANVEHGPLPQAG